MAGALALLGTTLTSYVYVRETVSRGLEEPPDHSPNNKGLARARIGAVAGAVFTSVILWFMLLASAATLGRHHETVSSAQDAARALRPLAGSLATDLFAVGLVTSAVVALPVLIATTAYVVGAQFDWRRGLSERVSRAGAFYGALAASIGLGLVVTLANVSVIEPPHARPSPRSRANRRAITGHGGPPRCRAADRRTPSAWPKHDSRRSVSRSSGSVPVTRLG